MDINGVKNTTNTNCLEGWKCPKCGNVDEFDIVTITTFRMSDEGEVSHGDIEWDDASPAYCARCDMEGTVHTFTQEEPIRPNTVILSDRELNQTLAALRLWQDYFKDTPAEAHRDEEHFEECEPMTNEEIDALCERYNLGPIEEGK